MNILQIICATLKSDFNYFVIVILICFILILPCVAIYISVCDHSYKFFIYIKFWSIYIDCLFGALQYISHIYKWHCSIFFFCHCRMVLLLLTQCLIISQFYCLDFFPASRKLQFISLRFVYQMKMLRQRRNCNMSNFYELFIFFWAPRKCAYGNCACRLSEFFPSSAVAGEYMSVCLFVFSSLYFFLTICHGKPKRDREHKACILSERWIDS